MVRTGPVGCRSAPRATSRPTGSRRATSGRGNIALPLRGRAASTPASGACRHSVRARGKQAFVWAFDLLALDGEDLRALPLDQRRAELQALLKRAPFGLAL